MKRTGTKTAVLLLAFLAVIAVSAALFLGVSQARVSHSTGKRVTITYMPLQTVLWSVGPSDEYLPLGGSWTRIDTGSSGGEEGEGESEGESGGGEEPAAEEPAAEEPAAEEPAAEEPAAEEPTAEPICYTLRFAVSNGSFSSYSALDQKASLVLFASTGIGSPSNLSVELTVGKMNYTGRAVRIIEGSQLYATVGGGWAYHFYDLSGEELTWFLEGGRFCAQPMTLTVTGGGDDDATLTLVARGKPVGA